ncbi:MAG: DUF1786 family protein [Candidatus Heimdallarchaeota archaeon]
MKLLAIDIGAGTEDLLLVDTDKPIENAIQRVIPSASTRCSERVAKATKDIFCYGGIIGGHPLDHALDEAVKAGFQVTVTETAALTFRYDLSVVRSRGFQVIGDDSAHIEALRDNSKVLSLQLTDVDYPRLEQFLAECQVSFSEIDVVLFCAQDHGLHGSGESAREVRFRAYSKFLKKSGNLANMLYGEQEVPKDFPRLRSNLRLIQASFSNAVTPFVMDSSPAILLGGSLDRSGSDHPKTIVNLGNGHTVVATLNETNEVQAICEHHTGQLRKGHLDALLQAYFAEELTPEQILREGGHGVIYREGFEPEIPEEILAIGPRRSLTKSSQFSFRFVSPLGFSMMMAGPLGMITAYEEKTGGSILEKML